jgi:hypothetical protein
VSPIGILTISRQLIKDGFYHLKFHFGSLFLTFQKWHLEVHRTIIKEDRGKKRFPMVIWAKNMSFLLQKELFL